METGAQRLRRLLAEGNQIVAAGAHDSLSARMLEEAGFDAIWASGFGLSAVRAVPDASILTMSETLGAARAMVDSSSLPVIADCDTGFGNAINVIRTVQDFEAAGVAAISIEDNVFPKRCSFYTGVARELAPVEEHAGKVRAAKSAQRSEDFFVIARTEALIAGWGKEEALLRARAYADAGADAILIHSKHPDFSELAEVARAWDRDVPLVSVPTTYIQTPLDTLMQGGFPLVIYANQSLRASVVAMADALRRLRAGEAEAVEKEIAPMEEIYRLVGVPQLKENEGRFLLAGGADCAAVVLAAGDGGRLGDLTNDCPKCMLDIKGRTLLDRQIEALNAAGIKDIAVVRGYQREQITLPNLRYYDNEEWAETGELTSLLLAKSELEGPMVCLYGDVIFDASIIDRLLRTPGDIVIAVDRAWADLVRQGETLESNRDLVVTDGASGSGHRFVAGEEEVCVRKIGRTLDPSEAHGEFTGLLFLSEEGARLVREVAADLASRNGASFQEAGDARRASLTDLLQELIDRGHEVRSADVYKGWMEITTFEDYRRAWADLR
jgi:phosphoenolpyruvate phosphomutase